ncbi:hypothetical protein DRO59_08970 [Candidatus Bathyarchaeota archaeon]|nr:MAG: hypothetical protein DRO59_08970 [Candidatus Bathyarchaeota archaeon]
MLRLLSDEDIKVEYREQLTKSIWCPALERYQLLIFCFACSRFKSSECKVPKENGILDLTVEDVMLDPASLAKSMSARIVKSEITSHLPKSKSQRKTSKKACHKPDRHKSARSKREIVLAYLKDHPDASASDVMKSCGVSRTYARRVLSDRA